MRHQFSGLKGSVRRAVGAVADRSLPVATYRGAEGRVTIVGSEPRAPSVAAYVCGDDAHAETVTKVPGRGLAQAITGAMQAGEPLIIRQTNHDDRLGGLLRHAVEVPALVAIHTPLPGDVETLREELVTSTTREDFRRIRRANFTYHVTTDPALVRQFHARHYAPVVAQQHPDDGRVVPPSTMLKALRHGGEIVCADIDGAWVAGIFNQAQPDHYALNHLGILDADPEVRRKRVVSALIVRSLERGVELGMTRATLGKSLPFLGIGPVWFKAKWGGVVSDDEASPVLHMLLDLRQRSVRRMLAHSPVIHRDDGRLAVSAWLEPGDEALKVILREAGRIAGVDRWFVFGEPETLRAPDLSTSERILPRPVEPAGDGPLWLGDLAVA